MVEEGKPARTHRNGHYPTTLTWPAATLSRSRGRGVCLPPGEGEIVSASRLCTHALDLPRFRRSKARMDAPSGGARLCRRPAADAWPARKSVERIKPIEWRTFLRLAFSRAPVSRFARVSAQYMRSYICRPCLYWLCLCLPEPRLTLPATFLSTWCFLLAVLYFESKNK